VKTDSTLHPFDILLEIDSRSRRSEGDGADADQPGITTGRLALRLGAVNLMFSMDDVSEIIPIPHISRVPGVKAWLRGISNLRGTVISIVDLREFFGGKRSSLLSSSRVVVVHVEEWHYGLLVDEVIGMRHFGSENRLQSTNTIDESLQPYIGEAYNSEDKLWLEFNVNRLLTDQKFLGAAS